VYFETDSFPELIEIMASCERLGLFYVVQKDIIEVQKWFGRKADSKIVYKLQVVQYVEEVEDYEEENLQGRPSESSNAQEETGGEEAH
jgi:hypothetical protein